MSDRTGDDLMSDAQAGGFAGRLAFGARPAVVVIDVVMAYLDPSSSLCLDGQAALAANARLVAEARTLGAPVVFTQVVYQGEGADGGVFFRKVPALRLFMEGSPLGDFPPSPRPAPGELVVRKQYPSAFFGTSLASTLRAMAVDTVVLTGFSTSGCVRASALDALQHGFIPYVVEDACADRDPRLHEANLFDIQAKIGEVVKAEEALGLMRAALHGGG